MIARVQIQVREYNKKTEANRAKGLVDLGCGATFAA